MKKGITKTVSITFRTTVELSKKLEELRAKENRNLSNMIEVLLLNAVKEK